LFTFLFNHLFAVKHYKICLIFKTKYVNLKKVILESFAMTNTTIKHIKPVLFRSLWPGEMLHFAHISFLSTKKVMFTEQRLSLSLFKKLQMKSCFQVQNISFLAKMINGTPWL
jgi:hypothetical protein